MDWTILVVILVVAYFVWRYQKNAEAAKVANDRLDKDTILYGHIKAGMREYRWREREQTFWKMKEGSLLFETAHLSAYKVDHFAEFRVGFYFKDIDEFGLYGHFTGNDDDTYESYCRSDQTFKSEQMLITRED